MRCIIAETFESLKVRLRWKSSLCFIGWQRIVQRHKVREVVRHISLNKKPKPSMKSEHLLFPTCQTLLHVEELQTISKPQTDVIQKEKYTSTDVKTLSRYNLRLNKR